MNRYLVALAATADQVEARADELNRLDAVAGDGDLGVTMGRAASVVRDLLAELDGQTLAQALKAMGLTIARNAPSTCGTLLATGLLSASRSVEATVEASAHTTATLLAAASAAITERGGAETGAKTLLDALVPAATASAKAADEGATLDATLVTAASAAELGAESTVEMRARFGRAGWLADRSAGHEDAGARLIAIIFRAFSDGLQTQE